MIAAISNVAPQATLTATPDTSLQEISVITDGDFSSVYTDSLSGEVNIEFTFLTPMNIGYIAIGGSNIAKKDSITMTATTSSDLYGSEGLQLTGSDGLSLVAGLAGVFDDSQLGLNESPVIMYKVDFEGVTSIIINVKGGGQISIAEIAMGDYYEIPRGEQSGFKRPWSVPNIQARSSVGLDNAPVNLSYESRSLSCTLNVPNNIMVDFDGWYKFINYAANNTFYILEDEDKFHSYACFNAVPNMTSAHSKTRSLGVSSIKFNAFAKSTEALF